MVDRNTIREKYESMSDSELFAFAREEATHLTTEGLIILNTEITNRNNSGIFEDISINTLPHNEFKYKFLNKESEPFIRASVTYYFDHKELGTSNEEIISGLMETGMEEADTFNFISAMNILALQRLKKADYSKLTGGLIMMCGVAITFLPFQRSSERLAFIIAWCMIIYGAGKLITGIFNSGRFKKIIAHITNDNSIINFSNDDLAK